MAEAKASENSERSMNVAALKRVDYYVKDIVDSASHVALYSFNGEENEWEKTEIEGALFIYSRSGIPTNSILIMNRLNTENLVEPVVQGLDLQLQEPFLLYRNSRCRIFGIWFYDREECVRIASVLEKLVNDIVKGQFTENIVSAKPKVSTNNVDIFGMLSKAQEDFNSSKKDGSTLQTSHTPMAPDVTSKSVMDFFAKASGTTKPQQPGMSSPAQGSGSIFATPHVPHEPIFQQLMSNPAHRVEHIEKQQRAISPQKPLNNIEDSTLAAVLLQEEHPRLPVVRDNDALSPVINSSVSVIENGLMRLRTTSPEQPRPALMPPTMFTSPAIKNTAPPSITPEPLTRNQLLQAVNYLLKNDPDFVIKLHEAYVKSFSELVS